MSIAVQTKLSWNEIFIKRVLVHQYILRYCLLATVQYLSKENGNTWSNNNVERRAQTFASFSTALFKMLQPFTLDVLMKQSSMSVRILVKKCSHLITQKSSILDNALDDTLPFWQIECCLFDTSLMSPGSLRSMSVLPFTSVKQHCSAAFPSRYNCKKLYGQHHVVWHF